MARVRRNVLTLGSQDQTLFWYGRAIEAMQNRPITDPTSWRFQAAIHDYIRALDPLAVSDEALPSRDTRNRFWRQCQHNSWFFLPWHRMYLHFFEQIVLAEVVNQGGPKDWALPYWDYSADFESRLLPEAFRNAMLTDGSQNFLFVVARDADCNAGNQFADEQDVELKDALTQANFTTQDGPDFGGPRTRFAHSGPRLGVLERVPHGLMHGAVAGEFGWMGAFNTAALDPIFWLHHCNLDRLWQVWLNRDPGHQNPTDPFWREEISFPFHDATGTEVTMRCIDVEDTSALDYAYEDVGDPLPAPAGVAPSAAGATEESMVDAIPPEVIGISDTNVQVDNTPIRIHVPTPAHAAARGRRAALAAAPSFITEPRLLLQLENLTASGRANAYDVYVNIPDGADPTQHPERYAGRLDLFGIAEASHTTDQHLGTGLTYTLNISPIYQELSTAGDWDPDNIDVSLVPVRKWQGDTVTVGRVSVSLG